MSFNHISAAVAAVMLCIPSLMLAVDSPAHDYVIPNETYGDGSDITGQPVVVEPVEEVVNEQFINIESNRERKEVTEIITAGYKPWLKVGMNGKLKCDLLPVSPSLKISMEHDKSLYMSVRAPFVGEVFRIEFENERLLIVNKSKKRYNRIESEKVKQFLSPLQSLMLGRVVVFGEGELSQSNCKRLDFVKAVNVDDNRLQSYMLYSDLDTDGLMLCYILTPQGQLSSISLLVRNDLLAEITDDVQYADLPDDYTGVFTIAVSYDDDGDAVAEILLEVSKYNFEAVVEMDKPEYGASLMNPLELSDKYKEVKLKEVLKF